MSSKKHLGKLLYGSVILAGLVSTYVILNYEPESQKIKTATFSSTQSDNKKRKTLTIVHGNIDPTSKARLQNHSNPITTRYVARNDRANSQRILDQKIMEARDLIDAGNPKEAKLLLQEIIRENPNSEIAWVELGLVELIDLSNPMEAKHHLETALKINPENRMVLSELVSIYDQSGSLEEGLAKFKSLQYEHENSSGISWAIGQTLINMGREKEAVSYLEEASKNTENPYSTLTDLAEAYAKSGNPEKALDTYRNAIIEQQERMNQGGENKQLTKERLTFLNIEYSRELIRQNKFEEAEALLNKVSQSSVENQDTVTYILETINSKRKKL